MLIFLGLSFLHVWYLKKTYIFFADRNLAACQRKICSMNIFKKARHRQHFWAFGLSFKEHCFHEFVSNLKTRHYEYALEFLGYCIYSCASMLSYSYITFFRKDNICHFLKNDDYFYKFISFVCLLDFALFLFSISLYFYLFIYVSLFDDFFEGNLFFLISEEIP